MNPSPKEDKAAPGPLRRGHKAWNTLTKVMDSIGTAWVFVLLVIINLDIGGRAIFNHPIRGVPEIVSMSIVGCVFLQIAHTLKVGRLTRADTLLNLLGRKIPALAEFLNGIYHLVGAGLFALLLNASYPFFLKAWRIDEYVGGGGGFHGPGLAGEADHSPRFGRGHNPVPDPGPGTFPGHVPARPDRAPTGRGRPCLGG